VRAIVFAADPGLPLCRPAPDMEKFADIRASAVGHVGEMAENLLKTVIDLDCSDLGPGSRRSG
jgi:cation transport protein ChaC